MFSFPLNRYLNGIAESYDKSVFFIVTAACYILGSRAWGLCFSMFWPVPGNFSLHITTLLTAVWCSLTPLSLPSSQCLVKWSSFSYDSRLCIFFCEMSVHIFCPSFNLKIYLLLMRDFCILDISFLLICKDFFPWYVLFVCFLNGVYRRANVLDEFNFFFFFFLIWIPLLVSRNLCLI